MNDVLVVGDAIVDFVFADVERYPEPGEEVVAPAFELRPGGSAGYASLAMGALERPATIVSVVGDGVLSDHWLTFLDEWGADTGTVIRRSGETISTAAAFLFETDRSFVTYRGAGASGRVPSVDSEAYDALLIAGFSQAPYLWNEDLLDVAEAFADRGKPVFLDTNWSPGDWQPTFEELLPSVEYLLVNEGEARQLANRDDLVSAGRALVDAGASTCAIKDGERGCLLVGTETERVETEPAAVVDACGAGDFFDAGFVHAIASDADSATAAAVANRCARRALTNFSLREKLVAVGDLSES